MSATERLAAEGVLVLAPAGLVSSLLAKVETARALWRTDPHALANLPLVLGAVHLIAIDEGLTYDKRLIDVAAAAGLPTASPC